MAPDRAAASHVAHALGAAGMSAAATVDGRRGWERRATKALERGAIPVLLLIPARNLGRAQLDLVERATAAGGVALAWTGGDAPGTDPDDQLTARLLEQRGALTDSRLGVLVEAARIVGSRGAGGIAGIRTRGGKGALAARVEASLRREGLEPYRGRARSAVVVETDAAGRVSLRTGPRAQLPVTDLEASAGALALLVRSRPMTRDRTERQPDPDRELIDLIAQPPARLLSETTSKRLLGAYGIDSGVERLCGSPTEAARFWSEVGSRVVLKLVRPELEGKAASGAIVAGVTGAAGVRRAFHSLRSLSDDLGPPEPLGVLVARQLDGGVRIWIRLERHARFGNLVIGGSGDAPAAHPCLALTAPVTAGAALAALERAPIEGRPEQLNALARGMASFGRMAHDLGDRISRAEIHPLVAPDDGTRALALDALIAISG